MIVRDFVSARTIHGSIERNGVFLKVLHDETVKSPGMIRSYDRSRGDGFIARPHKSGQ